jgi:hypothetical protein
MLNGINIFRGNSVPAFVTSIDATYGQFPQITDNIYANQTSFQSTPAGFLGYLSQLTQQTIITEVNASFSQNNTSLNTALTSLFAQMLAANQTVMANHITLTSTPVNTNQGNAACVMTRHTPMGLVAENCFPEILTATVTADGTSGGGGTAGSETITITGQQAVQDPLSYLYPGGSGVNLTVQAVNASLSNQGGNGNWLANSDFTNWQNNVPSSWRVWAGVPGTTIVEGLNTYDNFGNVCNFVGDGRTQIGIYQKMGVDNTPTITPTTRYSVNLYISLSTIPTQGVLEVALIDANGNVTTDAAGNPNLFNQSLTGGIAPWGAVPFGEGSWGLNQGYGAWGAFPWGSNPWGSNIGSPFSATSGTFRTPATLLNLPYALRIRLSTPLPNGVTLSIDRIGMTIPTSLYQQGPALAFFSGSLNLVKPDTYYIGVQNNGQGYFQTYLDRTCNLKGLGLLVPSSNKPNIPNSLISVGVPVMFEQGNSSGLNVVTVNSMTMNASGGSGGGGLMPLPPTPP